MDAYEIIEFIRSAKKKTPVKAYVKLASPVEFPNCRVFGAGDPVVFGDWADVAAAIEQNRDAILDIEVEQQPLHRCQVLRRLVEEHLVELTHVDSHATPRARPPTHGDRKWNANGPILAWVSRLLPSRSPCARLQSVSADRTA